MRDLEFERAVYAIVADTFSVAPASLTPKTTADDIAGWDSLGHSILLTRISVKLALNIDEDFASRAENLGEFVDVLSKAKPRRA